MFYFQFSDPRGYANLSLVWVDFSTIAYAECGIKVEYAPRAKKLYLENDSVLRCVGQ